MDITQIYRYHIYNLYKHLSDEDKLDFKSKINKIFEYYSCIELAEEYKTPYYEYLDIPASFKEKNNLSILDTGIDCCDLYNSIVQCKLRTKTLSWKDCATFIASKNCFDTEKNMEFIRWKNAIITRNDCCDLTKNLKFHKFRFIDKKFNMKKMYEYCDNIKPEEFIMNEEGNGRINVKLRDYQIECINIIKNQEDKNVIIKLPTGAGKNLIIINSLDLSNLKNKYLILVPRIVLMEQFHNLLISNGVKKSLIQCIGNVNSKFKEDKIITICVYNSIDKLIENIDIFNKIYIDEAHHIYYPDLYKEDDEDLSDEEEKEESYVSTIRNLHKMNNLIYLSATIDPIDGDLYYEKSLDFMISKEYLSDYQIVVPVFKEDPTNKNIAEYLLNRYFHTIIYCENQKEGKKFNDLLNKLSSGCSMYIDCKTKQKERKDILDLFQKGELKYLVNVRILTEGFDAPITQSVMFLHLPASKNTIIQCVGRALRKHNNKINAKIILPYSTDEDSDNLSKFINILSRVDDRCKKYKVNINKIENKVEEIEDNDENESDDEDDEEENTLNFKCEQLFDNISLDGNSYWYAKLEELKKYIKENNKTPWGGDMEIKKLGRWLETQKRNYKKEQCIMKHNFIRKEWKEFVEEYKEYLLSDKEKWYNTLRDLENYIKINKKAPSRRDKFEKTIKLGSWIYGQKYNYKKQIRNMKDLEINKSWESFINKYSEYLLSDKEKWYVKLDDLKSYIKNNNKTPFSSDKDKKTKQLGLWMLGQRKNYKKKEYIMKDLEIQKIWESFVSEHKEYFLTDEEKWYVKLNELEYYIKNNKRTPREKDTKCEEVRKLGVWLRNQKKNYKIKNYVLKDLEIRKVWEEFLIKYKEYFTNKN